MSGIDYQAPESSRAHPDLRRSGYGPYLLLTAVPWLLLATAFRMHARAQDNIGALPMLIMVQYALLIAFLLASHRMIQLAGGAVNLERLAFGDQWALARGVVWRILLLFFVAVLASLASGIDRFDAARIWLGLDNIVHPWPGTYLPIWSAFVAILVFLMVVQRGLGRGPNLRRALMEIATRWQHMMLAALMISASLYALGIIQILSVPRLQALYLSLPSPALKNALYLLLTFFFSYVRLWVTVAILTYSLRASYRRERMCVSTGQTLDEEQT